MCTTIKRWPSYTLNIPQGKVPIMDQGINSGFFSHAIISTGIVYWKHYTYQIVCS